MSEAVPELPAYDWPPTPILDRDVAAEILAQRLQQAWDDLEATRVRIALQLTSQGRPVPERTWVTDLQEGLALFAASVQRDVGQWILLHLTPTYRAAVEAYTKLPMVWTAPHEAAVTSLAIDTYGDFLQRARQAEQVSDAFVAAVRAASARELPQIAAGGTTARQAGDKLARRLIEDHGIDHVTYRDGSKVGVSTYARMAARTKSAVAYNAGSLNAYHADGVAYVEVFDGAGCGWTSHDDPDKAARTIRPTVEAARYSLAHPNCTRAFGARPDVTTPEEAATAEPFGPEPEADTPATTLSTPRPNRRTRGAQTVREARAARRAARTAPAAPAAAPAAPAPSPLWDTDNAELAEVAGAWQEEQTDQLADDSAQALKSYLGLGYERMNPYLRGVGDEPSDYVRGQIAALDRGFEDAATSADRPLAVFRGGIPDTAKVGDELVDDAFMSTSWDPTTAREFGNPVLITVPAGARFLVSRRDREVLFPRGTRMRVVARHADGRVELEVVT